MANCLWKVSRIWVIIRRDNEESKWNLRIIIVNEKQRKFEYKKHNNEIKLVIGWWRYF